MYYFDGSKYTFKVYGNNGKLVGANQKVVIKLNKKNKKLAESAKKTEEIDFFKLLHTHLDINGKILTYSKDSMSRRVGIETMESLKQSCSADLFEEYTYLEFEGKMFMSVKKWDEWLRILYGNYMNFPPKEEQTWTHHPIVIDFEHNYEEIEVHS